MRLGRRVVACASMLAGAFLQSVAVPAEAGEINVKSLLQQLQFLQDGKTGRAEVLARLGDPETTYSNGLVASYSAQLIAADNSLFVCPCLPGMDIKAKLRLTLQYSPDGVLIQHDLIHRD